MHNSNYSIYFKLGLPFGSHDRPHFRACQFREFLLRGMGLRLIAEWEGCNTPVIIGTNEPLVAAEANR
jgi:hypothetical protein